MQGRVYITKKTKKHLGSRFKRLLLKYNYNVVDKVLKIDDTDILYIVPGSTFKRIDSTYNGLKTSDKNISNSIKIIKRIFCFSFIDKDIAYKELRKSLKYLNKIFLYIQMSNYNTKLNLEFSSIDEMIKFYQDDTKFVELESVLQINKNTDISQIVELFLENTNNIFFKNKTKNIYFREENKNANTKKNLIDKSKNHQEDDFYVLTKLIPSVGLKENEKKQFEDLLSNSLSLNYAEKMRVIKALPSLSRFQMDELMKLWVNESHNFKKLKMKDPQKVLKLQYRARHEWIKIKHKTLTDTLPSPRKISMLLKEFIKGQDHIIKPLATILHYQREIKYNDNSTLKPLGPILLAGPTGSGKSFIVKKSADFIDVPYIHVDSTSLVSAGIKGYGIQDIFKDLLRKVNFDVNLAENAIVFFDEFDKLLISRDGMSILNQILRIIEGHKEPIIKSFDDSKEFDKISFLNTKHILFIFGGSFEHILKEKNQIQSGFLQNGRKYQNLSLEDLKKSGFPRELLGRIKKIFQLHPLTEKEYFNILKTGKDSPLINYLTLIKETHGKKVTYNDDILKTISKMAVDVDYGARGLEQIIYKLFEPLLYEIPESNKQYSLDINTLKNYC